MLEQIKKIRELTGAGIVEVKKALEEASGDEKRALEIIRKKGLEKAAKKLDRQVHEGIVATYVHSNQKLGAIVSLYCETDFVARNEEFKVLATDIAMHITAMAPQYVKPEDVSEEFIAKERLIWTEQLKNEGKPENIWETILSGKEKKLREEMSLLTQPFVKNPDQTIGELIAEKVAKIGENIQIGEFKRVEL